VRRSERRPGKLELERLQQDNRYRQAVLSGKCDGLIMRLFPGIGRGIEATRTFSKFEFVVEYSGKLIRLKEAQDRENEFDLAKHEMGFMFYFRFQEVLWCVDATDESDKLGRLVNHARGDDANLYPQIVVIDKVPHIALIASDKILPGSQLMYDYGDRRKAAVEANPWLRRQPVNNSLFHLSSHPKPGSPKSGSPEGADSADDVTADAGHQPNPSVQFTKELAVSAISVEEGKDEEVSVLHLSQ
jgi:SET domain